MDIEVQNNSGLGKEAELPQEVRHFNWAAFFLTWIWGVCNSAYLSLISLAFNIITWVVGFILTIVAAIMVGSDNAGIGGILYFGYTTLVFLGGIAIRIWLGIKGNQWAWQNKKWNSTEHFNKVQKNWVIGTIIAAIAFSIVIFAYIGVVAAMTMPSLMSNTASVKNRVMMQKSLSVLTQAAVMNEAMDSKCGQATSSEALAKCFSERFNGQLVGNKIELNDGVDLIFHTNRKCVNDGTCYVIIDTATRARGSEKATVRLYSDKYGYIKLHEEDTTKLKEKYSSR